MENIFTSELYNTMMDYLAQECANHPSVMEKFIGKVRQYANEDNLD